MSKFHIDEMSQRRSMNHLGGSGSTWRLDSRMAFRHDVIPHLFMQGKNSRFLLGDRVREAVFPARANFFLWRPIVTLSCHI
jgi:hypothetical protein